MLLKSETVIANKSVMFKDAHYNCFCQNHGFNNPLKGIHVRRFRQTTYTFAMDDEVFGMQEAHRHTLIFIMRISMLEQNCLVYVLFKFARPF